jgi:hypothetical protein
MHKQIQNPKNQVYHYRIVLTFDDILLNGIHPKF